MKEVQSWKQPRRSPDGATARASASPREIREATGIHEGTKVSMETRDGVIIIRPATGAARRIGRYTLPDLDALFAGYHGPQAVEDGFAAPAGREEL